MKARILAAAADEFSEHGLAGARYDRIAARAPANKERIYSYFGDKSQLFGAILEDRMPSYAAAHAFGDPLSIRDHAGKLFDFHADNPQLTRLAMWEALHYGANEVPGASARAEHYRGRRQSLATEMSDTTTTAPGHLSFALSSLVTWWFAAPHLARFHIDGDPSTPEAQARHRALVIDASARLLAPQGEGHSES